MKRLKIPKMGSKFGNFTIMSGLIQSNSFRKIKCRCKCGKESLYKICILRKLKSCHTCSTSKFKKYKLGDKNDFNLIFIKYIKNESGKFVDRKYLMQVKCNLCEKIKIISSGSFLKYKSCGCLNNRKRTQRVNYKGREFIDLKHYNSIINNSIKTNRDFNLDIDFVNDLLIKQNHKCALSGIDIKIGVYKEETTASLDRIDSKKGYTKDNVQWLHKVVQRMKSDYDQEYFKYFCFKIVKNLNME